MIEFEWYIRRARIDLGLFFEVENIKSDEDLAKYCRTKNLSLPKEKYFSDPPVDPEPVASTQIPSARKKATPKPRVSKAKESTSEEEATEVVETKAEKPAKKTRRTTRKKTAK